MILALKIKLFNDIMAAIIQPGDEVYIGNKTDGVKYIVTRTFKSPDMIDVKEYSYIRRGVEQMLSDPNIWYSQDAKLFKKIL